VLPNSITGSFLVTDAMVENESLEETLNSLFGCHPKSIWYGYCSEERESS